LTKPALQTINRFVFGWRRPLRALVYAMGMTPGLYLFARGALDDLGADPLSALERGLGLWALKFLLLSLCVTPLRRITGLNLLPLRRALGLVCFFYALAHVAVYLGLDRALDGPAILKDILKRPYIFVGLGAFALLGALAATSSDRAVRALGAARWSALHKAAYGAAALGALHYAMSVKILVGAPLFYLCLTSALLVLRMVLKMR
jgi:sulfoxide reductase heme-binding subunit YedZ